VVEITKMEQRLQHFKDMSASEFKDFVEKNTTHTNEILGLEPRSTDTETGITNQRTPRARLENSQYVGLQHRFFSTSIPAVNGQAAPQNPPPSRRFGLNLPITLI
jgi:hypothetical protein